MGGMQKHSYYLTKYLARNKVEVVLYHSVKNGEPLVEKLEGFTDDELKYITHYCFQFPKLDSFPGHYLRENKRLSELYLKHFTDNTTHNSSPNTSKYIYAQGFVGWAFIESKKKGIDLPEITLNFHGLEMFQKAPSFRVKLEHLLLRGAVKYNVRNAGSAISLGGKLTNILKEITAKQVIEQGIGIEESWLIEEEVLKIEPSDVLKFVFVGRYERRKGIEELNEVIRELLDKEFEFHFIGPVPEEKKLGARSSKLKVHYHGQVSEENKIKEILQACDVLVSPSWSEGMPTVILEAMASGCAIIATDVGAVAEQVDSTNGWLIGAGRKKQLKEALTEAININKEELFKKKINSIQKIKENFLWDDVIKKTIIDLFSDNEPYNVACAKQSPRK